METILVKAGRMPGRISEFAIMNGQTIVDLLRVARFSVNANESILVNGEPAPVSSSYKLSPNDMVVIQQKPALKEITVKFSRIGEVLHTTQIVDGSSVSHLLSKLNITVGRDEDIWLHSADKNGDAAIIGRIVGAEYRLMPLDVLVLEPKRSLSFRVSKVLDGYRNGQFRDLEQATKNIMNEIKEDVRRGIPLQ